MKNSLLLFFLFLLSSIKLHAYDFEDYGMYYNVVSSSDKTCGLAHVENGIVNMNDGKIIIPQVVAFNNENYTVVEIQSSAFSNLITLTSVEIPSTIKSIGNLAFSGCSSITSFTIPSTINKIGDYAFQSCLRLESIVIENSNDNLSLGLKVFKSTPVKSAYIGRSFTAKNDPYGYAESVIFSDYKSLVSLEFGNNVTSIPKYAFYGCQFTDLTLPDNLTVIPACAFESCWSLQNLVLPKNLQIINEAAFRGCGKLSNIEFPSSLSYIGWDGFMDYNGTSIDLSNTSVYFIGSGAFRACENLSDVILPESLTTIEPTAFQSAKISSIRFPASVNSIGSIAFNLCENLTSVYCESVTPPDSEESTFDSETYQNASLYVPYGSKNIYSRTGAWKYFKTIQEVDYTGIEDVLLDDSSSFIYFDINGRRVQSPNDKPMLKKTNNKNVFIVL